MPWGRICTLAQACQLEFHTCATLGIGGLFSIKRLQLAAICIELALMLQFIAAHALMPVCIDFSLGIGQDFLRPLLGTPACKCAALRHFSFKRYAISR